MDAVGNSSQGSVLSLDGFGNTLAIGGDGTDDSNVGAAWVFVRSNSASGPVWTQQGPKLVGTGAIGGMASQGGAVALSAGGNTLLSAGFGDNDSVGAVWVFARYNGVWVQAAKLTPSDAIGDAGFGSTVALDADGTTAAIGGGDDNMEQGAAWVYV